MPFLGGPKPPEKQTIPFDDTMPKAESGPGSPGAKDMVPRSDHQHPRLTSSTNHTLGTNGEATVTFTRKFDVMPAVTCMRIEATDNQPVEFSVKSFTQDAQGKYTGCIIRGRRAQQLPTLSLVSGILTAVITGVNGVVGALTGFNVFGGSAANVQFSCIAVASSAQ